MRHLHSVLLAAPFLAISLAHGQVSPGYISMCDYGCSSNLIYVTEGLDGTPLSGAPWIVQLWGAVGTNLPDTALSALPGAVATFGTGGFNRPPAGTWGNAGNYSFTDSPPGTIVTIQLRAWYTNDQYTSFDAARSAGLAGASATANAVLIGEGHSSLPAALGSFFVGGDSALVFTATPTNGPCPLTVQFMAPASDSLGYPVTRWDWTFGDGNSSTNQNPSHTYINAGNYSISLAATNDQGGRLLTYGPTSIGVGAETNLPNGPDVLVNGSFELPVATASGGWYDTMVAGTNGLPGWSVLSNSVDAINGINYSYWTAAAYDGVQCLDLDGTPGPGSISQVFPSIPGAVYQLSFAYANNFNNQASASNAVALSDASGTFLGPFTISHSSSKRGDLAWSVFTTNFEARTASTTVAFVSLTPLGLREQDNGGILLDAVSVDLESPVITNQPLSIVTNQGDTVAFQIGVAGSTPFSYQWMHNGANLIDGPSVSGSTTTVLTLSAVQTNDGGSYSVAVTNPFGLVRSSNAVLIVNVPPGIASQPTSVTNNQGTTVTFTVGATGTAPLSYQWKENGVALPDGLSVSGATNATLVLMNVQTNEDRTYSVVVSNSAGSTNSAGATLTVEVPPTITKQPISVTTNQGSSVSFSVTATGTAPLAYQWRLNSSNLVGQTKSTLTLTNVSTNQDGGYSVVITNVAGSTASSPADLTVLTGCYPPPSGLVAWWPMDGSVVDVIGTNNPSALNGVSFVSGEVGLGVTFSQDGYIEIPHSSQIDDQTFTYEAWALPLGAGPNNDYVGNEIINNSADSEGAKGYSLTWRATDSRFTFCWGETSTRMVSAHAWPTNTFYDVVGTYDGTTFKLYVDGLLEAQTNSQSAIVYDTSIPWAIGSNPEIYRNDNFPRTWNGIIDEVSIYNRALTSEEVEVLFAGGSYGKCEAPVVVSEPTNVTVLEGATAVFSVMAQGTAPVFHQWKLNGASLFDSSSVVGATSATLTLLNVQTNEAGTYSVLVTNAAGFAQSSNATLTVNVPPTITQQPTNVIVVPGATASFTVAATGTAPLTYQWKFNGSDLFDGDSISGATSAALTLLNVSAPG